MKKAISLLSGGLDSTTVLAIAKQNVADVTALSFDYGQRHKKELEFAKYQAKKYNVEHRIINLDLRAIGGSALTADIEVPNRKIDDTIPITYVPARNTIFLAYALALADVIGADRIFIGVNALDYSGYPDCRPEYITQYNKLANLATVSGVSGRNIAIEAPLQFLDKRQIIEMGTHLNVDYKHTWSCYNGREKACGKCDSCKLRLKGFLEAGVEEPLEYEIEPL